MSIICSPDARVEYSNIVADAGIKTLNTCDCNDACYKCLQHFRNQMYHDILNRFEAMDLLAQLQGSIYKEHEIPAQVKNFTKSHPAEKTESIAEEKFLSVLGAHGFSMPTNVQYRVELNNGNYTVADFAWAKKRILIYVDGTSSNLHGNPQTALQDTRKRTMLKMQGWNVIEISYQALDDEQALALKLEELNIYLSI